MPIHETTEAIMTSIRSNTAAFLAGIGSPVIDWPGGSNAAFLVDETSDWLLYRPVCRNAKLVLSPRDPEKGETQIFNGSVVTGQNRSHAARGRSTYEFTLNSPELASDSKGMTTMAWDSLVERLVEKGFTPAVENKVGEMLGPDWFSSIPSTWFASLVDNGFVLAGSQCGIARVRFTAGHVRLVFSIETGENQLKVIGCGPFAGPYPIIGTLSTRLAGNRGMEWIATNGRAPGSIASSKQGTLADAARWLGEYLETGLSGHGKLAFREDWRVLLRDGEQALTEADPATLLDA